MKYIKTLENQINYKNINRGDYVIVTCTDYNLQEEIMIVNSKQQTPDGFNIRARLLSDMIEDGYTIFDHEIVEKISPKQAEIYLTAKKYNL